jgi:hypothetical protein
MIIDLKIEVVVLFSISKKQIEVVFLSPIAGPNQSAELWRSQNSGDYALYHQDAYYNGGLAARRAQGKMCHPKKRNELIFLIGNVWGAPTWSSDDTWEIARSESILPDVAVDEF